MTLRETAMDILTRELPQGVEYRSDAPSAGGPNRYEQLTGYSHANLKANWDAGGQKTACMGYVAHYCTQMKFGDNLGRFDLETYLPTQDKEYAWIRAKPGREPKEGDILLHSTTLHVDVAMGFKLLADGKTRVLVRGAAGQGTVGKYDIVKRVQGTATYNVKNLKGWVDIDLYMGAAPSTSAGVPPWLKGWWKVWDGNTYYYYFGNGSFVQYTKTAPAGSAPPVKPASQGDYTLSGNSLVVNWNPTNGVATEETFDNAFFGTRQMNGRSNRFSPLVATKI
jgi:hypothetical protein